SAANCSRRFLTSTNRLMPVPPGLSFSSHSMRRDRLGRVGARKGCKFLTSSALPSDFAASGFAFAWVSVRTPFPAGVRIASPAAGAKENQAGAVFPPPRPAGGVFPRKAGPDDGEARSRLERGRADETAVEPELLPGGEDHISARQRDARARLQCGP